jgi:hypothetical protein
VDAINSGTRAALSFTRVAKQTDQAASAPPGVFAVIMLASTFLKVTLLEPQQARTIALLLSAMVGVGCMVMRNATYIRT